MDYKTDFKNKKITLVGLGLLGRGVGDARFLAQCGAQLTVTDLRTETELKDSLNSLRDFPDIHFVLGGHTVSDFTNADLVFKAPATPKDSLYIKTALDSNVHVTMSTALFVKYAQDIGATVVGVTGTRGKTTVTYMIYETLKKLGMRVHIGGNIRGVSTLALLNEVKKGDIVVLELDSWQLQGFAYEKVSPHIAVFNNLMEDHLNYYVDMDEYFEDKTQIFLYQKIEKGDTLIVGEDISERIIKMHPPVNPMTAVPIPSGWNLQIPGIHNRENAALATEALSALGVSVDDIKSSLTHFAGVEGRLEFVREINGVQIYNDNNATSPDATVAAIESFKDKSIILIAGGTDKGSSITSLVENIQNNVKKLVCIDSNATGTQKLLKIFPDAFVSDDLEKVVLTAFQESNEGDIILFSPAFSSFGVFKNEYDRGDKFKKLVQKYL